MMPTSSSHARPASRVCIVGLGLIGGSLGLALRQHFPKLEVFGISLSHRTVQRALVRGAITQGSSNYDLLFDADVIFLASPVMEMDGLLEQIAPKIRPGTIVTDVGSTKTEVMKWAAARLPAEVAFIGGHPMAGSDASGIDAADPHLLDNCTWVLTPRQGDHLEKFQTLYNLLRKVTTNVVFMDATTHDEYVAAVSHLPLLLSCALMRVAAQDPRWEEMGELAATGFRDMTRLAGGRPVLSEHIVRTNLVAIRAWIDRYEKLLNELRNMVSEHPEALREFFDQAHDERLAWKADWDARTQS